MVVRDLISYTVLQQGTHVWLLASFVFPDWVPNSSTQCYLTRADCLGFEFEGGQLQKNEQKHW